uniref:Reverse transcriptase domain-containing protein n=1 Tax=Tanacetum cinerariifolium TaxID=118510 RepID=A0A6L2JXC2_TANCI|nr:hypothetical protein [Tanacetum cinerariifolium]
MTKVNNCIAMDSKAQESSTKRTAEHLEFDISKKQKVDENVEPVIDDSKELRKCIEIVPENEDEVHIEATPIYSRSPTIIDYEIHKEGKKNYFKIIRAYGNSQVYQTFEKMFKNLNREDLEVPWAIVKDRFKKEKLVDDMDNILFRTLKTMFEHHVEDTIVVVLTGRVIVPTGRVVVPTGRVIVSTGRVVVPTGRVIVPTGRVVVPTGRESSKGKNPPKTSKTRKSVHVEETSEEATHKVVIDVEEPTQENAENNADQPLSEDAPKT